MKDYITTVDFAWPERIPTPMLPLPEDVPRRQTPEEIIGPVDASLVRRHFEYALWFGNNPDAYDKGMQKKFNEAERALVGDIYKILRKHGWWPDRIDSCRRLVFAAGCFSVAADKKRLERPITKKDIEGLGNYFSPKFVDLVKRKLNSSHTQTC